MYFRRGALLESTGSMVQFGEFLIAVDPVQLNTREQDQQDPKTIFMRSHVHACAKDRLGLPEQLPHRLQTQHRRPHQGALPLGPHWAESQMMLSGNSRTSLDRNQQRKGCMQVQLVGTGSHSEFALYKRDN